MFLELPVGGYWGISVDENVHVILAVSVIVCYYSYNILISSLWAKYKKPGCVKCIGVS
jgi:hypothetical protein